MTRKSARKPMTQKPRTVALRIADIAPDPDQPRKTLAPDGLTSLAHSLLETGQISPIVVRPGAEGKYTIVVGERRWRAAREAGLTNVECIIRYDVDEQKARKMQLVENFSVRTFHPWSRPEAGRTILRGTKCPRVNFRGARGSRRERFPIGWLCSCYQLACTLELSHAR